MDHLDRHRITLRTLGHGRGTPTDRDVGTKTKGGWYRRRGQGRESVQDVDASRTLGVCSFFYFFVSFIKYLFTLDYVYGTKNHDDDTRLTAQMTVRDWCIYAI
jgi:hypothetical protein